MSTPQEFLDLHSQIINPGALPKSTLQKAASLLPPMFRLFNWPPNNCETSITPILIQTVSIAFVAGDIRTKYLLIQNNGAVPIFYAIGRDATVQDLQIVAGGNYEPLVVPTGTIYLLSSVANTPAVIVYGM